MSDELRIAVATEDRWLNIHKYKSVWTGQHIADCGERRFIPEYDTDINAIRAAVLAKGKAFTHEVSIRLVILATKRGVSLLELTATDECDAFLEVARKEKE